MYHFSKLQQSLFLGVDSEPSQSPYDKGNGERIGSTLGEVISVDAPDGGRAWGTCIRVRVHIDITKLLYRGRMVQLGASDRQ